jgi:hypothetical protein
MSFKPFDIIAIVWAYRVITDLVIGFKLVHDLRERQLAVDVGVFAEISEVQQVVTAITYWSHDKIPPAVRHLCPTAQVTLPSSNATPQP